MTNNNEYSRVLECPTPIMLHGSNYSVLNNRYTQRVLKDLREASNNSGHSTGHLLVGNSYLGVVPLTL